MHAPRGYYMMFAVTALGVPTETAYWGLAWLNHTASW